MPDVADLPLAGTLAIFAAAAAVVWFFGVRLARWADELSRRTGIGEAVLGLVLLGGITSLPEVAVSVTAAAGGDAPLAVNNLLGGLAFQVAILAVADLFVGRDALTSVNAEPVVLLQGTLDCIMLIVVAMAVAVGELPVFGVGAWSFSLLPLYLLAVTAVGRFRSSESWRPARPGRTRAAAAGDAEAERAAEAVESDAPSTRQLVWRIAGAAAMILLAGAVATLSAEAIAEQSGLGQSFVGAVLLAAATSFPELSTAIEAVRLRRYTMAFADVFGTNLVDVALILLVDAIAAGPPVLGEATPFSITAALLGALLTMIYLAGLIERRNRAVLRMGVDSIAVIAAYLGGLVLLYRLR